MRLCRASVTAYRTNDRSLEAQLSTLHSVRGCAVSIAHEKPPSTPWQGPIDGMPAAPAKAALLQVNSNCSEALPVTVQVLDSLNDIGWQKESVQAISHAQSRRCMACILSAGTSICSLFCKCCSWHHARVRPVHCAVCSHHHSRLSAAQVGSLASILPLGSASPRRFLQATFSTKFGGASPDVLYTEAPSPLPGGRSTQMPNQTQVPSQAMWPSSPGLWPLGNKSRSGNNSSGNLLYSTDQQPPIWSAPAPLSAPSPPPASVSHPPARATTT